MDAFDEFYRDKKVLVTGHTGFKGAWLSLWLNHLGAEVVGCSLGKVSEPDFYTACQIGNRIESHQADILDFDRLHNLFTACRPDIVFHLAAQPIVYESYKHPRRTVATNVMGTVNVLEAARCCENTRFAVVATSDKCYRNKNWAWGYRETDDLGHGADLYSTSKACAELVVATYQNERFLSSVEPAGKLSVVAVRSGNVIGGGDWAEYRLIPDIIRSLHDGKDIHLRCPQAVRPWQHVLASLSGYLWLGRMLTHQNSKQVESSWNIGSTEAHEVTVGQIVRMIQSCWGPSNTTVTVPETCDCPEAQTLRVDCSKAIHHLNWLSAWDIHETIEQTVNWYKHYYQVNPAEIGEFSLEQIENYTQAARDKEIRWATLPCEIPVTVGWEIEL